MPAGHVFTGHQLWKDLPPETVDQFQRYLDLRSTWAATHNMSGPMALEQGWECDVSDAIAVSECLIDDLPLYDVGSGSGVPGLLVGILRPDQPIYLVEPRIKRVAFMRAAVQDLGLKQVKLIRERWPVDQIRGPCQVVSRAVVDPEVWPSLALSGGEQVVAVLRMLAANRPEFALESFSLDASIDYDLAEHGKRRVERWGRVDPQS